MSSPAVSSWPRCARPPRDSPSESLISASEKYPSVSASKRRKGAPPVLSALGGCDLRVPRLSFGNLNRTMVLGLPMESGTLAAGLGSVWAQCGVSSSSSLLMQPCVPAGGWGSLAFWREPFLATFLASPVPLRSVEIFAAPFSDLLGLESRAKGLVGSSEKCLALLVQGSELSGWPPPTAEGLLLGSFFLVFVLVLLFTFFVASLCLNGDLREWSIMKLSKVSSSWRSSSERPGVLPSWWALLSDHSLIAMFSAVICTDCANQLLKNVPSMGKEVDKPGKNKSRRLFQTPGTAILPSITITNSTKTPWHWRNSQKINYNAPHRPQSRVYSSTSAELGVHWGHSKIRAVPHIQLSTNLPESKTSFFLQQRWQAMTHPSTGRNILVQRQKTNNSSVSLKIWWQSRTCAQTRDDRFPKTSCCQATTRVKQPAWWWDHCYICRSENISKGMETEEKEQRWKLEWKKPINFLIMNIESWAGLGLISNEKGAHRHRQF